MSKFPGGQLLRVWKIMAGEGSKFWKEFVSERVVAIRAREEGDLDGYSSQDELLEKTGTYHISNRKNSGEGYVWAWSFVSQLEQGDLLLLYRRGYVLALGCVTGEYTYSDGRFWRGQKFFHRRRASWKVLDTPRQKLSPRLKGTLAKLHGTLEEISEKEDILEVCHLATKELFCQEQNQLSIPPVEI